jgi:hypothetical protein
MPPKLQCRVVIVLYTYFSGTYATVKVDIRQGKTHAWFTNWEMGYTQWRTCTA